MKSNPLAALKLGWIIGVMLILIGVGVIVARSIVPQPTNTVVAEGTYTLNEPADSDMTLFADTVTIAEQVNGNLTVISRVFTLAEAGHVTGNLWVVSDQFTSSGQIDGDLTAISDQFTLAAQNRLSGSLTLLADTVQLDGAIAGTVNVSGGDVTVNPAAIEQTPLGICANTITGVDATVCERSARFALLDALISLRSTSAVGATVQPIDWSAPLVSRSTAGAFVLLAVTLGLVGIAALIVAAFPRQIGRIEDAIRAKPGGMGGAGLALYALAFGISGGVIILIAIAPPVGLILLPVYLLLTVILSCILLAGVVTLALVIGAWLTRRFTRSEVPPLVTVAAGGLLLWLIVVLAAVLPFGLLVGAAALGVVSAVGAGAALFTRLGTRPLRESYFIQG